MRSFISILSILIIAGLASATEWPAPSGLIAYSGLPSKVQLSWNAPPPVYSNDTLAYDTGLVGGGGYADLDSGYYSVRFTPARPCSVLAIRAYFFAAGHTRQVRYHFWGVSAYGFPDIYTNLFMPVNVSTIGTGWNEVNVAPNNIVFDGTRDFYLGVHKRDTIPELGIAYDDTISGPVRSYRTDFYYGGNFATPGDLLIRLVVVYLDDRSIATLTGTVGKIVSPIVPFPETYEIMSSAPIPERFRERPSARAPLSAEYPVSYTIFRATDWSSPMALSFYTTVSAESTSFVDNSVFNSRTYYYTIRADFASGVSALPETVFATPYSGTGTTVYDTFIVDDGVPDAGVYYDRAILANRFHVPTRCKLIRLQYQINAAGRGVPKVYLGDRGTPAMEILGETTPYSLSAGWVNLNVSGYRVFVEGDFWVGLQMDGLLGLSLDVTTPGFAWDRDPLGVWHAVDDTTYFIRAIVQYSTDNAYYHLQPGWNAVSLPVIPTVGLRANDVFPFAIGGEIYGWDANSSMWTEAEWLVPGKGYFVLSGVDTFYNLTGIPIHEYNFPWAGPNWEFIGGLSKFGGADTSAVTTQPADLWVSPRIAFYWEAGYHRWNFSSKLMPSYAYFVLLNGEGLLNADE